MWIPREITESLSRNNDVVQILLGPRQVGKTSLLEHISAGYRQVSLDDLRARTSAEEDPETFLSQFGDLPVLIDEAQYAPNLFPALKRRADRLKKKAKQTHFRLTASNHILMDRAVKEGLTGRASYFELNTLSVSEILRAQAVSLPQLLFQGGWPELYAFPETNISKYLDNYVQSYIEKDIVLTAGIQKSAQFLRFIGLLAGRTGQLLNKSELGKLVGVDASTVGDWISVLERMKVIALVQPYTNNFSKRLTKAPKLYFLDTGLACRLQGWSEPAPIMTSPQFGPLFETLVFAEIYKFIHNHQKLWQIFHWRTRDGEEIDFIIQLDNQRLLLMEAKVSAQAVRFESGMPELNKTISPANVAGRLICYFGDGDIIGHQIPIAGLANYLSTA